FAAWHASGGRVPHAPVTEVLRRAGRRLCLRLLFRCALPRQQDIANHYRKVRLAVPFQAAIVFAAAEVLDVELGGSMGHYLADHAGPFQVRLANLGIAIAAIE